MKSRLFQGLWILQIFACGYNLTLLQKSRKEYMHLESEAARADTIMSMALDKKWTRKDLERSFKTAGAKLHTYPKSLVAEWNEDGWTRFQYVSFDQTGEIVRFRWWYESSPSG